MKKITSFLLGLSVAIVSTAQTATIANNDSDSLSSASTPAPSANRNDGPQFNDFSRWSITVEAGDNVFDGDLKQEYGDFFSNVLGKFSLGASLEYGFHPLMSVGLGYNYHAVDASWSLRQFDSKLHYVYPFLSVNMLRLFNRNVRTHWGIWASVGGGVAHFDSHFDLNDEGRKEANPNGPNGYKEHLSAWAIIVPVSLNVEYNITNHLAAGLRITYNSFNRDDIEGNRNSIVLPSGNVLDPLAYKGVTNDFLTSVFIDLRWKFGASSKPHVRNITWNQYEPDKNRELMRRLDNKMKDLATKDDLKKLADRIDPLEKAVDTLKHDVDSLKKIKPVTAYEGPRDFYGRPIKDLVANGSEYIDTDGDGVPNSRDLDNNTPPNTPVDFYGREIPRYAISSIPTVYFDFDKANFDKEAEEIIGLVAELLRANSNALVEIRAYSDFVGTAAYNLKLSQKRAEVVKNALVKVWGIASDRIITNAHGRLLEPKTRNRANRRAEFHFSE